MKILTVIPFSADNAVQAEKLLDFKFMQANGNCRGHVLLVAAPDCHAEMRQRIKISAELSFIGVHELELRPLADPKALKTQQVNNAFRQSAQHIVENFNWPFFWCEPDCVPTRETSFVNLFDEYENQPKGYMGTQMKAISPEQKEMFFMARNGIYPQRAFIDLFAGDIPRGPFEIVCGDIVAPKMTANKLIQQTSIVTAADLSKVRMDALFVHGDKGGHLLAKLQNEASKPAAPVNIPVANDAAPIANAVAIEKKKPGRKPKPVTAIMDPALVPPTQSASSQLNAP